MAAVVLCKPYYALISSCRWQLAQLGAPFAPSAERRWEIFYRLQAFMTVLPFLIPTVAFTHTSYGRQRVRLLHVPSFRRGSANQ